MGGLDDAGFASLYDARAASLLDFFTQRAPAVETTVALWAETLTDALTIRHRYRGNSREQAALWLEAIAYRQLALFRARAGCDPVNLR